MTERPLDLKVQSRVGFKGAFPVVVSQAVRHTSSAIQRKRHIKLPQSRVRTIACTEQCLVAALQRFPHQFATVGCLYEVVTVGCIEVEAVEERVFGIHLKGVAVALAAVEVRDVYLVRVGIIIDNRLLGESCVVVLRIELQRLPEERNVGVGCKSVVPGTFLL